MRKTLINYAYILIRIRVVKLLGDLKDSRAVLPLINALNDKSEYVRSSAAGALGNLKDSRSVPVFSFFYRSRFFVTTLLILTTIQGIEMMFIITNVDGIKRNWRAIHLLISISKSIIPGIENKTKPT